mmetsp:Transcript_29823/g.44297  ORF Transcript_29823/g.44297 Transcript_29823/m.44297 type:complete len:105 (-) Transcript_29823:499-813(-)
MVPLFLEGVDLIDEDFGPGVEEVLDILEVPPVRDAAPLAVVAAGCGIDVAVVVVVAGGWAAAAVAAVTELLSSAGSPDSSAAAGEMLSKERPSKESARSSPRRW